MKLNSGVIILVVAVKYYDFAAYWLRTKLSRFTLYPDTGLPDAAACGRSLWQCEDSETAAWPQMWSQRSSSGNYASAVI